MNRQKLLLSVLLVILALSLVYSYWKMPRQKTVETLPNPPGQTAGTRTAPQPSPSGEIQVRLDLLARETGDFTGFKRNIFGPLLEERKPDVAKSRPPAVMPAPPPPPVQPAQPPPVQRVMAQFTFLGFLEKDNRKTIFLTSNNELYLVKKGDVIAGRYQVANVTDEMMTIRSTSDGGEIVIPLIENRPLNVMGQ